MNNILQLQYVRTCLLQENSNVRNSVHSQDVLRLVIAEKNFLGNGNAMNGLAPLPSLICSTATAHNTAAIDIYSVTLVVWHKVLLN